MDGRLLALVVTVAMFGLLFVAGAGGTVSATDQNIVDECAAEPPEDFAPPDEGNAAIGWFDGYWYNQRLDIDASEGITEEELDRLSARTAARFEAMRCLPMQELPPVEIITREEFAQETAAQFENVTERERLFDNTQFETLLTIGSTEDTIDVRESSRTVTVGGYYNFVQERIVVITDSEDPDTLFIDETILAHELGHAIQDQHFDLETYARPTTDLDNAILGVIEGDVHRIEQEYLNHCEADRWSEPCIVQPPSDGGSASPPSWGLYFMQFQPYSDGPNFVEHVYEQGDGWDDVNALYDDMPESSSQVISPTDYGTVSPVELAVKSDASNDWERLSNPSGPDYNVIGEAGMAAMFIGQSYESILADDDDEILDPLEFQNLDETGLALDPFNPINYNVWPTNGWAGDRFYVYTDEDGRTGSVWKTAWEDRNQRDEFLTAYEMLARDRGGERVDGYAHTWEFGAGSEYDMAMTIYPDGDRLWIVTAPTVSDLTDINGEIELLDQDDTTQPPNGGNGFSPTDDDDGTEAPSDDDDGAPGDGADDTIPGFGPLAALLALAALASWRRHHR